jgi:hypothetical protein
MNAKITNYELRKMQDAKSAKEERKGPISIGRGGELITNYELRIMNYGISTRSVALLSRAKKETISAAAYVQSGTDDRCFSRGFQSTGGLMIND